MSWELLVFVAKGFEGVQQLRFGVLVVRVLVAMVLVAMVEVFAVEASIVVLVMVLVRVLVMGAITLLLKELSVAVVEIETLAGKRNLGSTA